MASKWLEMQKTNKDVGSIDQYGDIYDDILRFFAQPAYEEKEYIPKAPRGGDPMPYEYMSDQNREQMIQDVVGEDAVPLTPEERSKWLDKVFGK